MATGRFQRGGQPTISFFAFQDIITAVIGILVVVTLLLALHLDTATPASTDENTASPAQIAQLDTVLAELTSEKNRVAQLQSTAASSDPEVLRAEVAGLQQQLAAASASRARQEVDSNSVTNSTAGNAMASEVDAVRVKIKAAAEKLAELERSASESAAAMADLEQQVKGREADLLSEQQKRNQLWLIPEKSGTSKEPLLVTVDSGAISLQRFGQSETQRLHNNSDLKKALKNYSNLDFYLVFYFKPSGADLFDELTETARHADFEIGYDTVGETAQLNFGPPPQKSGQQ